MHTQIARPLLQPSVLQSPRPGPRTRDLRAKPPACKCRGREPCSPCHAHIYPHALCHCPAEPASLPARDALPCPALASPGAPHTQHPVTPSHPDAGHPRASLGEKKREREMGFSCEQIYLPGSNSGIRAWYSAPTLIPTSAKQCQDIW